MELFPSWIPWSHPRQTIPYLLQSTASPPVLTSTYSGITIIIKLLSTVSLVSLPIGPTLYTTPELPNEELKHLREALEKCKNPRWAIDKIQNKYINNNWEENGNNNNNQEEVLTQGPNNATCTRSQD